MSDSERDRKAATCECDAPRCEREGCQDKPTPLAKRPEGREGIVTVYDHEDNYLGCMGVETWQSKLREEPLRKALRDVEAHGDRAAVLIARAALSERGQ